MFIASAISNIFQNYNHCSLEMEQLSTDISIAKICLLNYFFNCWWLSYRQNTYGKKKMKTDLKIIVYKIVYNVCREGHFHPWQNSYSPTVLGRVGLDHECEAHAGTFLARRTNKYEKTAAEFAEFKKKF